jgi:mRNA interferase HigB
VNVISKTGLNKLLKGKSDHVRREGIAWFRIARAADWDCFAAVREQFPNADLVKELLVFNIRQNRYRLIVYPKFAFRTLYIKAVLTHAEYLREEWKTKWP